MRVKKGVVERRNGRSLWNACCVNEWEVVFGRIKRRRIFCFAKDWRRTCSFLKRDTNSGGLVLQTAPDADVLLGVARRAILDAFPSKADDVEDKRQRLPKRIRPLLIPSSLVRPRVLDPALFTVNCVVGATSYHGIVNAYTGEELVSSTSKEDDDNEEEQEEEEEESERTRGLALALPAPSLLLLLFFFFFSVVLLPFPFDVFE